MKSWAGGLAEPLERSKKLTSIVSVSPPARGNACGGRVQVQFDFAQDPGRSSWLILDRADGVVCFPPPHFDTDVRVRTSLVTLDEVWLGRLSFGRANEGGLIEVRALPTLERAFPGWFLWSPAADAVRAHHPRPVLR